MSIVDNIQLPPTLLSRFDLIYLILGMQTPPPPLGIAGATGGL